MTLIWDLKWLVYHILFAINSEENIGHGTPKMSYPYIAKHFKYYIKKGCICAMQNCLEPFVSE